MQLSNHKHLIRNIEYLAETYTAKELDILAKKGTSGSNWGGAIKMIQDLIQSIVNCIKPYIQNLIFATPLKDSFTNCTICQITKSLPCV